MANIRGILVSVILLATFLSAAFLIWRRSNRRIAQIPAYLDSQWDILKEKRKFVRFKQRLAVTCSVTEKGSNLHHTFSNNISGAGVCLEVPEMLPDGVPLVLKIEIPDSNPITAKGEVVWVKESQKSPEQSMRLFETGIRITEIESRDRERLNNFLLSAVWLEDNR